MTEPRKCEHCGKELELISGTLLGLPMYYLCECGEAAKQFAGAGTAAFGYVLSEFLDPRDVLQEQIARTIPQLREKGPI